MTAKTDNGKGASKVITPEMHDATRRAQKARQKSHTGGRGSVTEGYLAGYEQDRLNNRGVKMLDHLTVTMASPSPAAHNMLRHAALAYVSHFTALESVGWLKRHQDAKAKALSGLEGRLHSYASLQLDMAFRATSR